MYVLGILLILFAFIGTTGSIAFADSKEEQPFTIYPVLPANQDTDVQSYISINTSDDALKQKIAYEIENNTDKPLDMRIEPLNAVTSPNGVIHYTNEDEVNAKIINENYRLVDYISVVDSVTIQPGERITVKALVDIPKSKIDGTVLGAIGFQVTEKGAIHKKEKMTFQINNETNVIMGVQVNFGTDKKADFQIDKPYVDPMPSYYAVRLPVTSSTPLIMSDVLLKYEVLDENNKQLFKNEDRVFKFAPNTKTNIVIPWNSDSIEKGKTYTLKGSLNFNDKSIEFEKTFTYKGDAVDVPDGQDFDTPTTESNTFWLWLLLGLAVLLGAILYVIYKNKNKYVLYSDSPSATAFITKEDELFNDVKRKKDVKNTANLGYMLTYKPVKQANNETKTKEIMAYKYASMKKVNVNKDKK